MNKSFLLFMSSSGKSRFLSLSIRLPHKSFLLLTTRQTAAVAAGSAVNTLLHGCKLKMYPESSGPVKYVCQKAPTKTHVSSWREYACDSTADGTGKWHNTFTCCEAPLWDEWPICHIHICQENTHWGSWFDILFMACGKLRVTIATTKKALKAASFYIFF